MFQPQDAGLTAAAHQTGEGELRPTHGVLNPGRMAAGIARACRPVSPWPNWPIRYGGVREDPAHLRALRLLHGDLPDLCAARRRAGQPRGRIYLIKDMLENDRPAKAEVARHLDRCLSCLSCMTTCPSGVHYMHLIDHGRRRVQETFKRPLMDRSCARFWPGACPDPGMLFRLSLAAAWFGRPFARLFPGRLGAMLGSGARQSAQSQPGRPARSGLCRRGAAPGPGRALTGCAQQVLAPQINEATVRLLTRARRRGGGRRRAPAAAAP